MGKFKVLMLYPNGTLMNPPLVDHYGNPTFYFSPDCQEQLGQRSR